jgi:stress-induced-phosphoprotein 1
LTFNIVIFPDNWVLLVQTGLKYNEGNQELMDGARRCIEQINKVTRGDISAEDLKEKQAKAMQDPEIQGILSDPIMRQASILWT